MSHKKVLLHLGSQNPNHYILTKEEFLQLKFNNLPHIDPYSIFHLPPLKLLSIDMQISFSSNGGRIAEISLVDEFEKIIFFEIIQLENESDLDNEESKIDKKTILKKEAEIIITKLIENHIVIGHDIAIISNIFKIEFPFVIDTVLLFPHKDFFQLNKKKLLHELIFEHLHYEIQDKSNLSKGNALALMRLVKKYINDGKGKRFGQVLEPNEGIFQEVTLPMIYKYLEFQENQISCVYLRGSRSIGTNGVRFDGTISDWDFVIVMNTDIKIMDEHLGYGNIDAALYDKNTFRSFVSENIIWVLECLFAPKNAIFKEEIEFLKFFQYNPGKIRNSVSCEISRQVAKGKRLFDDPYKGLKCLFIAMRFYFYGSEIAKFGYIKNFQGMNYLWEEMKTKKNELKNWKEISDFYQPKLNQMKKEFLALCPYQNSYMAKDLNKVKTFPKHNKKMEEVKNEDNFPAKNGENEGNSELEVIKYLKNNTLTLLCSEFKIKSHRHAQYPNLIQLHYQAYSDFSQKIPCECRGIILDESHNWELIALPFFKFFDCGDSHFKNIIDWDSAVIYDKIDGSIATLYYYQNKWNVASSSCPDGSAMMCFKTPEKKTTMEQLFWRIFEKQKYKLPENTEFCYMFEVITKDHVIVVEYEEENLILIGARNLKTLQEEKPEIIGEKNGWNHVKPIKKAIKLEDIFNEAQHIDSSKQEGFVVCDKFFNRIKVKSPEYLKKNWMFPICPSKHQMNERHILYIIRENEGENFVKYCPEWKIKYEEIKLKYDNLRENINNEYNLIKNINDEKEFALMAKKYQNSHALFALRRGYNLEEYFSSINVRTLEKCLGIVVKEAKFN